MSKLSILLATIVMISAGVYGTPSHLSVVLYQGFGSEGCLSAIYGAPRTNSADAGLALAFIREEVKAGEPSWTRYAFGAYISSSDYAKFHSQLGKIAQEVNKVDIDCKRGAGMKGNAIVVGEISGVFGQFDGAATILWASGKKPYPVPCNWPLNTAKISAEYEYIGGVGFVTLRPSLAAFYVKITTWDLFAFYNEVKPDRARKRLAEAFVAEGLK